jgi:hypothetical protein
MCTINRRIFENTILYYTIAKGLCPLWGIYIGGNLPGDSNKIHAETHDNVGMHYSHGLWLFKIQIILYFYRLYLVVNVVIGAVVDAGAH